MATLKCNCCAGALKLRLLQHQHAWIRWRKKKFNSNFKKTWYKSNAFIRVIDGTLPNRTISAQFSLPSATHSTAIEIRREMCTTTSNCKFWRREKSWEKIRGNKSAGRRVSRDHFNFSSRPTRPI